MKRYHTVIFDLDGTIIDSRPGIEQSMRHMFGELEMPQPSDDVMLSMIGPPLYESYTKILGLDDEAAWRSIRVYRAHYAKVGLYNCSMYPGMLELIKDIHGAGDTVMIATSKLTPYAEEVVRHIGIAPYVTQVNGPDADGMSASKAELIAQSIKSGKAPFLMVGDRKYDIDGAKECGIDCAAVLFGYGTMAEFEKHGPTHIARDADALRRIWLGEA